MNKYELKTALMNLQIGEELMLTNEEGNFGISKIELFNVEHIVFGYLPSNMQAMSRDIYQYEQIMDQIETTITEFIKIDGEKFKLSDFEI